MFRQPSAWVPLLMSISALVMIVGYVATFGIGHHQDEGAAARIFQLLMLAQLPMAAYFALKWLPRRPAQALLVLTMQAVGWMVPVLTIIWLESL